MSGIPVSVLVLGVTVGCGIKDQRFQVLGTVLVIDMKPGVILTQVDCTVHFC